MKKLPHILLHNINDLIICLFVLAIYPSLMHLQVNSKSWCPSFSVSINLLMMIEKKRKEKGKGKERKGKKEIIDSMPPFWMAEIFQSGGGTYQISCQDLLVHSRIPCIPSIWSLCLKLYFACPENTGSWSKFKPNGSCPVQILYL